jgi:hypothetical protein
MAEAKDTGNWAEPVERLHVEGPTSGKAGRAVEGRRPVSPLNGFGQMWQKTYRVDVGRPSPEEVIRTWKTHFGEFWPSYNRFYAPLAGVQLGEVAVIQGDVGPVTLSTGVRVIYSDSTSFAYMTPEGHPFAGFITFSAHREEERCQAEVQLLIRAGDPISEVGFMLGGSKKEDEIWDHTLKSLAARFGSSASVTKEVVLIDRRREWRNWKNLWKSAALRARLRG